MQWRLGLTFCVWIWRSTIIELFISTILKVYGLQLYTERLNKSRCNKSVFACTRQELLKEKNIPFINTICIKFSAQRIYWWCEFNCTLKLWLIFNLVNCARSGSPGKIITSNTRDLFTEHKSIFFSSKILR